MTAHRDNVSGLCRGRRGRRRPRTTTVALKCKHQ